MPKGGPRVGSGRKPLLGAVAALRGSRGNVASRAVVRFRGPVEPVAVRPPEPVTMPGDLSAAQAAVWLELAPHALALRTLTPETAGSFRDLCRVITVRDGVLATIQAQGWTYIKVSVDGAGVEHSELKKHPLVSDLRGWEQRVEVGRARFRLAPMGKEILPAEKPADPFEEFEVAQ